MARRTSQATLERLRVRLHLAKYPPLVRKLIVGLLGLASLVAGIIMIFFPGPAFVFIPLGILLLACEFKWAERQAFWLLDRMHKGRARWRLWRRRRAAARRGRQDSLANRRL
jgi:uncharacterized protein (TIGR02611 family)